MKRYKILETVMLGFNTHNDQYNSFYDPGTGFELEREEDGDTIFIALRDNRKESITQSHAIEVWLEDGKIEEIADE